MTFHTIFLIGIPGHGRILYLQSSPGFSSKINFMSTFRLMIPLCHLSVHLSVNLCARPSLWNFRLSQCFPGHPVFGFGMAVHHTFYCVRRDFSVLYPDCRMCPVPEVDPFRIFSCTFADTETVFPGSIPPGCPASCRQASPRMLFRF